MTYREEFPEFGDMDVAIPDGFVDCSWHNDACPCFSNVDLGVFLWVDHADRAKSEFPDTPRFVLTRGDRAENEAGAYLSAPLEHVDALLATDDYGEVLEKVAELKAVPVPKP